MQHLQCKYPGPPPHKAKFHRLTVPKSQAVKSSRLAAKAGIYLRYRADGSIEQCRQQEQEDQCRQQEKVANLQTLKCPPSSPAVSSDNADRAGRLLRECWAFINKAGGAKKAEPLHGQNRTLPQPASQPASPPLPKGAGGKAASPLLLRPNTAGGAGGVKRTLPEPPPRPKRALPPPAAKARRKGPSGGGRPVTKGVTADDVEVVTK